ncbi:bifunctional 3-phenylpropionate/cinnamic acid dioxygenase ferredoxin subunit [Saccharopolyspora rhizosphaerae]|uniref:bifunctional 3-phenylpropionate/cinnamic acid dioxygenase ferredoxin subunit n=1 Tax=Saccharopolyspora rhizosphaerae TaxID=2492662 RepID=UPI0018F73845|nr:bifunctional 3-phenylpropionate/cinnamic acid dioxygenase ferredoxin subunit [Saccharopolyspora rhizosphaerae]
MCRLHEFPPGALRRLDTSPPVVVFNVGGWLYAIDDVCTHACGILSEGHFDGTSLECPVHLSRFDVRNGEPLCPPATEPVRTHRVEVSGNEIVVHIDIGRSA